MTCALFGMIFIDINVQDVNSILSGLASEGVGTLNQGLWV
jgi:hypothetical protein